MLNCLKSFHFLPPNTHTFTCVYQGVRNVTFSENFGYVLIKWPQWLTHFMPLVRGKDIFTWYRKRPLKWNKLNILLYSKEIHFHLNNSLILKFWEILGGSILHKVEGSVYLSLFIKCANPVKGSVHFFMLVLPKKHF